MDNTEGWAIDVDLIVAPMAALGWQVTAVKWRSESPDWNEFDAVYVGVPWDYPEDPAKFDALVDAIDQSSAVLVNESRLLRWGMGKTYLRDLESRGVPIVPSLWPERVDRETLRHAFERFASERLIVKPVVGANAVDTFVIDAAMPSAKYKDLLARLQRTFAGRACLVQPFIGNIVDEGEYSLFFMGGEYSHAIRKVPKKGIFASRRNTVRTSKRLHPTTRCSAQRSTQLPTSLQLRSMRGSTWCETGTASSSSWNSNWSSRRCIFDSTRMRPGVSRAHSTVTSKK